MNGFKRTLITLVALATAAPAFADQRDDYSIYLRNSSGTSIVSLQVSHVGRQGYGDNILSKRLRDGYRREVDLRLNTDYCRYDVMVEFADGATSELRDVFLCNVAELSVDDDYDIQSNLW